MGNKHTVALLAEGVDRNSKDIAVYNLFSVALLAEGVDRNLEDETMSVIIRCRPPRGGRG